MRLPIPLVGLIASMISDSHERPPHGPSGRVGAGGRSASVRVETLTRFFAQPARLDHAQQQGRRTVVRFFEFLEHFVRDQFERVQANEIGQPQGTHRVRQPGNDGLVDVLDGGNTGTGLKKCRPSTRCGFLVAAAIFMIGMLEVLDASTDSGSVTTRSSSAKICPLTASSSTTASITSCRSARSLMSVVKASWESARSRSRSVTLPALTPRSSDFTMRLRPAAISASVGSYTVTPTPARTATSAIPDPICPAPTTPTRSITASSSNARADAESHQMGCRSAILRLL